MSLSKTEAVKLFELGFKRPDYADPVYPQDIYDYQSSTWAIGGRILPSGNFLCEERVYKEGTWIPGLLDLISWLEENDMKFNLSYSGTGYKVTVTDSQENEYSSRGVTLEFAFFKVIIEILQRYGGNPVNKQYEVIEAELIDKTDL